MPLLAASTVVAWVAVAWDELAQAFSNFSPILTSILSDFMFIGKAIWEWLRPPLAFLGSFLGNTFLAAIMVAISAVKMITGFIRKFGKYLMYAIPIYGVFILALEKLGPHLESAAKHMTQWLADFAAWLADLFNLGMDTPDRKKQYGDPIEELKERYGTGAREGSFGTEQFNQQISSMKKPKTTFDFRGSKITLKQEFRQADPDRVAIQMMKDLARYSEQRVTSGFVPPTTG